MNPVMGKSVLTCEQQRYSIMINFGVYFKGLALHACLSRMYLMGKVFYYKAHIKDDFSHVMRKPVFEVSDLDRHKLGCTATEDG